MRLKDFYPKKRKILVKVIEDLNHKNGLIFNQDEKPHRKAIVVKSNYEKIKDGSIVVLDRLVGTTVEFEDDDNLFLIVNPYQILGILKD
jgi:co-chaperonin GroES (HSP10)